MIDPVESEVFRRSRMSRIDGWREFEPLGRSRYEFASGGCHLRTGRTGRGHLLSAFKKVKEWAWESYWMIYAIAGLVVVPLVLAFRRRPTPGRPAEPPPRKSLYCYLCGAMWGIGGLTWGLMIRYLGIRPGTGDRLRLCSPPRARSLPPIFSRRLRRLHSLYQDAAASRLAGVGVSLAGNHLRRPGRHFQGKRTPEKKKKKAIAEYDFKKGILIAIFSGVIEPA